MNDFEDRLKQLLNEQVDHELASRPQAPPVQALPRRQDRGRRRPAWLLPLLAAAAVIVAVVGGGVVAHSVANRDDVVAPATDSSSGTPSMPAPSSASSTSPSNESITTSRVSSTAPNPTTSHATTVSGSDSSGPPAGTTVMLEGALIALPDGWVAHAFDGGTGVSAWCLRVKGGSNDACAVELLHYKSASGTPDPDREGFVGNPPQYVCGQSSLTATKKASTATFGGRTADVREFDRSCAATGKKFRTLQYLVVRAPTWGLIVTGATTRDRDVARRIVTDSVLPR